MVKGWKFTCFQGPGKSELTGEPIVPWGTYDFLVWVLPAADPEMGVEAQSVVWSMSPGNSGEGIRLGP